VHTVHVGLSAVMLLVGNRDSRKSNLDYI